MVFPIPLYFCHVTISRTLLEQAPEGITLRPFIFTQLINARLISIMLSRFRMTVDDCIEEYKTLGERIFGHPRPLAKGAILWHKFSAKTFEEVIRDVTARHSSCGEFAPIYPSDEDLCRT